MSCGTYHIRGGSFYWLLEGRAYDWDLDSGEAAATSNTAQSSSALLFALPANLVRAEVAHAVQGSRGFK